MPKKPLLLVSSGILLVSTLASACGHQTTKIVSAKSGTVLAVGAENEYADVISQIGGQYVTVTSVMNNPNTDPHTFESSPSVASQITKASLVIQNGVGYDSFMNKIESSSPSKTRKVIDVQHLLGLPDSTPNPHLWYSPFTMPRVAAAIASDLTAFQPSHASYFHSNLQKFTESLTTWTRAISVFAKAHPKTRVAVTEPVADYMLQAADCDNLTPFNFQADIMNGVDPSPQDLQEERAALSSSSDGAQVFVYNQQVTDSVTESLLQLAHSHHIPVVGVYETMPTPGYDYQSWMEAEVRALNLAVTRGVSSSKL